LVFAHRAIGSGRITSYSFSPECTSGRTFSGSVWVLWIWPTFNYEVSEPGWCSVNVTLSVVLWCTQTLLDLGASPNYKDERGLTPLYHAVMKDSQAGPQCVQMLLFNRSDIGLVDATWNTELHQVIIAFFFSLSPGFYPDELKSN